MPVLKWDSIILEASDEIARAPVPPLGARR
jgi:hypothetical protein